MDSIPTTRDTQSQPTHAPYHSQKAEEAARLAKLHAKFANVRELVLHDIGVSLQAVLDLKTQLNTLTAIGRLPEELVAQIMTTFVQELYYSESARRDSACSHRHQPPRWLKLAHVCRSWRNVALHTTQLWSHVYLTRPDAFALFVERSKASPLDIAVRHNVCYNIRGRGVSILDLIPPVSSRIRSLSVDEQIPAVQAFCKQLTQPLEQLEKLVLASRLSLLGLSRPPPAVPFVAAGGLTPRLRNLEIDRLPFHWTDPAFCVSLTTLKVTAPAWQPSFWNPNRPNIGTTVDLLDVLERIAPRLEVLELNDAIPMPDSQNAGPPPLVGSLSLPSLRALRLSGPTYDCADLLSRFSMNQEAEVHLIGSGSRGMEDLIRHLSVHLGARPLVAVRLGPPYGIFNIDINGWQTTAIPRDRAPIRLAFSRLYGGGEADAMQTFVREGPPLLSHAEHLELDDGPPHRLAWSDLFSLMPRVRTLAFNGHPFNLFDSDALLDVRRTLLPSGQSVVPLPELRAVHFHEVLFRYPEDHMPREFIDDMLAWIALRSEHGMPLDTLELRNCQHAEEKDIERLRTIVPNVVWDGSGMDPVRR